MHSDSSMLLALLAVRQLGGVKVARTDEPLKTLKKLLDEAKKQDLLKEEKIKVAGPVKNGKPTSKSVAAVSLTPAGEQFLKTAASPESLAATQAGALNVLRAELDKDRQELRAAVTAPGKSKPASLDKLQAEVAILAKKVTTLAEKLHSLDSGGATLAKLDSGFASLLARLDQALAPSSGIAVSPSKPPPTAPPSLENVLGDGYDKLRRFLEFQDGLVELPRLYHETRKQMPDLTLAAFHAALMDLWQKRTLELHILNEEYKAAEPDKGIRHNQKLYYYVIWKRS